MKKVNINKTKRLCKFIVVFLISFVICIFVTITYIQNKCQLEYVQMEHVASTKANKINNVISKLLYRTQTLSALVIQKNGDVRNFEEVAATIIDDPAIKNVIIAPDGIVSNVYPFEGNEKVIGLDYFSDAAGNKEAAAAKQLEQLVLGGPFDLVQGGQALVGRLPVYLDGKQDKKQFWGIVSVTLSYPQALDGAELEELKEQGFAYEIWRISPDNNERQIIANSNYTYNKNANYVELPMSFFNAEWYFRLSPIRNWYQHPEMWIYTIIGFFISILIGFLVMHNYDLNQMKSDLEELTIKDTLTGILNRRGAFQALESLLGITDKKFVLCYMDLNKFKMINDSFGHNIGDQVLRYFTSTFEQYINKNHIFARMGGDEFVLIFKDTDSEVEVDLFFNHIYKEFEKELVLNKKQSLYVTFSIGKAVYPRDGVTIDELIAVADNAMYQQKQSQ